MDSQNTCQRCESPLEGIIGYVTVVIAEDQSQSIKLTNPKSAFLCAECSSKVLEAINPPVKITAAMIKEVRDRTGAGVRFCKDALVKTNGKIDDAVEYLQNPIKR